MKALAVIGANYGDEGKGLVTDYLARQGADLVVRFNGGANAGHTVCTEQAGNHVFHSFGSGALYGVPTLLTADFIVNPLMMVEEMKTLGFFPKLYVDPDAWVTTHFDMLLNQYAETVRGTGRHGSVGVGINETVMRSERGFPLHYSNLSQPREWWQKRLNAIRKLYVPDRIRQIGGTNMQRYDLMQHVDNIAMDDAFFDASMAICLNSSARKARDLIAGQQVVIFEGAQGLALDQNFQPGFPHVTRSNTGITNVLPLLPMGASLETYYVTRTYTTRHGAGPLPDELPGPPVPGMHDSTNVAHAWQGDLRYAWLDIAAMAERIAVDMKQVHFGIPFQHFVAITCLDQTGDGVDPESVAHRLQIPLGLTSEGPTAATVTSYNAAHAALIAN